MKNFFIKTQILSKKTAGFGCRRLHRVYILVSKFGITIQGDPLLVKGSNKN
jgi:hypothetical protein